MPFADIDCEPAVCSTYSYLCRDVHIRINNTGQAMEARRALCDHCRGNLDLRDQQEESKAEERRRTGKGGGREGGFFYCIRDNVVTL